MYVHTDKYGRKRKFANAKAARQWERAQSKAYVPTLEEDVLAFAGMSTVKHKVTMRNAMGVVYETREVGDKYRRPGAAFEREIRGTLTRTKSGGKKLAAPRGFKVWSECSVERETGGKVTHYTAPRSLVREIDGERVFMRISAKPVSEGLDLSDKADTRFEAARDHANRVNHTRRAKELDWDHPLVKAAREALGNR